MDSRALQRSSLHTVCDLKSKQYAWVRPSRWNKCKHSPCMMNFLHSSSSHSLHASILEEKNERGETERGEGVRETEKKESNGKKGVGEEWNNLETLAALHIASESTCWLEQGCRAYLPSPGQLLALRNDLEFDVYFIIRMTKPGESANCLEIVTVHPGWSCLVSMGLWGSSFILGAN